MSGYERFQNDSFQCRSLWYCSACKTLSIDLTLENDDECKCDAAMLIAAADLMQDLGIHRPGKLRCACACQAKIDAGCMPSQGKMKEKTLTHKFSLTKTGATTDKFTPFGAVMMIGSSFLYALIQAHPILCFAQAVPQTPEPVLDCVVPALRHGLLACWHVRQITLSAFL